MRRGRKHTRPALCWGGLPAKQHGTGRFLRGRCWRLASALALGLLALAWTALPPEHSDGHALAARRQAARSLLPAPPQWSLFAAGHLSRDKPAPLANNVARASIMGVEAAWDELGLYGQGQVIAVADTGLDTGDVDSLSADFAGRLRQAFALGRPEDWSDPNGHGTHVAGSALGSGAQSGADPATHRYAGSFAGVAPEAELVFQSVMDAEGGLGGLPEDLGVLLGQAYEAGARVHTNSWGGNFFIKPLARFLTAGRYDPQSVSVDQFLWDHPDMVVLFAAGNHGVDLMTPSEAGLERPLPDGVVDLESVAVPATAKNVITVGASEGLRSEGGHATTPWRGEGDLLSALLGDSFSAEPIASDLPSDNPDGMAPFSGRGPTNDGRIKPDVVAPGTNIVSARSHANGAEELFGVYDDDYVYCSGTSMATPLVAGVVALIRQWYVEQQAVAAPSAALIKATLINGATDIRPGQYGTGPTQDVPEAWPNPVSGWGRVNLRESIAPDEGREVWFADQPDGLSTGEEATFTRHAAASGRPLRVTLVWTDPPGAPEPEGFRLPGLSEPASPVLVNDLDLTVETPDGRVFFGNMGASADRLNNVEAVRIADPPAGEYRILVSAHQVQQGPQPFALVAAGQRILSGVAEGAPPRGDAGASRGVEEGDSSGWLVPLVAGLGAALLVAGGALFYARRGRGRHAPTATRGGGRAIAPSQARLRAEDGLLEGQTFEVARSPFRIGRGADNELMLPEAPVSRYHAQLEIREGRWVLMDLDSANGTLLNRQPLGTPQPLHSGDLIGVGGSTFLVRLAVPQPAAPPATRTPRRSRLAVAVGIGLVALLVVAAAVLLAMGRPQEDELGSDLPSLPGVDLSTVAIPTGLPSIEVPTGMPTMGVPTGVPGIDIPDEIPTGLPIPTGGFVLPTPGAP